MILLNISSQFSSQIEIDLSYGSTEKDHLHEETLEASESKEETQMDADHYQEEDAQTDPVQEEESKTGPSQMDPVLQEYSQEKYTDVSHREVQAQAFPLQEEWVEDNHAQKEKAPSRILQKDLLEKCTGGACRIRSCP